MHKKEISMAAKRWFENGKKIAWFDSSPNYCLYIVNGYENKEAFWKEELKRNGWKVERVQIVKND